MHAGLAALSCLAGSCQLAAAAHEIHSPQRLRSVLTICALCLVAHNRTASIPTTLGASLPDHDRRDLIIHTSRPAP